MPKPIAEFRRPEIVNAAFKAISTHGLAAPPYDLIAREAGMSRQLIRHYFPDPEQLMIAVCDKLASAYRNALTQGIIKFDETQRLPTFLNFYFNFLGGEGLPKPADDQIYDAMFSLATASPTIRQNLHGQYSELMMAISHEVQVSHPNLPQRACREIGFLFASLMYGHWKMVASLGFSADMNRVTREALDRLIESYVQRYDDPDKR